MAEARRPRRAEGEVRDALLEATERQLAQRSLADLTVGDVLREAQVSRASFYFYFASKHDVVIALAERVLEEVQQGAAPWLQRSDLGPEESLRAAMRGALGAWERHRPVLRAVAESWHASPELGDLWGSFVGRFVAAARAQLQRERAAGVAPADDTNPDALAAALIWMNERVFYLWATGAEPSLADADTVVETLTAIWMRSMYRG